MVTYKIVRNSEEFMSASGQTVFSKKYVKFYLSYLDLASCYGTKVLVFDNAVQIGEVNASEWLQEQSKMLVSVFFDTGKANFDLLPEDFIYYMPEDLPDNLASEGTFYFLADNIQDIFDKIPYPRLLVDTVGEKANHWSYDVACDVNVTIMEEE